MRWFSPVVCCVTMTLLFAGCTAPSDTTDPGPAAALPTATEIPAQPPASTAEPTVTPSASHLPPPASPKPAEQLKPLSVHVEAPGLCAPRTEIPKTPGNGLTYSRQPVPEVAWDRAYITYGENTVNGRVCSYWLDASGKDLASANNHGTGKVPTGTVEVYVEIDGGWGDYTIDWR